jgi:hypothetical protein
VKASEDAASLQITNLKEMTMKNHLLRISITALLAVADASAQDSLQAYVPFGFAVGGTTLQAGHYTVSQVSLGSVRISCSDCRGAATVMGRALYSPAAPSNPRLVFHRYGDRYFLSEVWGTANDGRQFPKTRQERELTSRSVPANTTVAAVR